MQPRNFFRRMIWYSQIFFRYSAQYMKTKMAYRSDFFVFVISDFLLQLVNLVFILVIFTKIQTLKGWDRNHMLFIYGFFLIPFSIYSGFLNQLFDVPDKYVLQGELDRVLVRPMNTLFQVIVETMNLELLLGAIPGFIIMFLSASAIHLDWRWSDIPLGLVMVFGATLIYAGIYILLASLGFWFEGNMGLMPMIYNLSSYGRYPTTVYKGIVRFVLTWILPFAFVGFYPATILMHNQQYIGYALLTPVVGIVFFAISYLVWQRGILRYVGSGS